MEWNRSFLICNMPPAALGIHGWNPSGAGLFRPRSGAGFVAQIDGSPTGQLNASGGKRAG